MTCHHVQALRTHNHPCGVQQHACLAPHLPAKEPSRVTLTSGAVSGRPASHSSAAAGVRHVSCVSQADNASHSVYESYLNSVQPASPRARPAFRSASPPAVPLPLPLPSPLCHHTPRRWDSSVVAICPSQCRHVDERASPSFSRPLHPAAAVQLLHAGPGPAAGAVSLKRWCCCSVGYVTPLAALQHHVYVVCR